MILFKKTIKVLGVIFGVLVLFLAGLLLFYTLREYRPKEIEKVKVSGEDDL